MSDAGRSREALIAELEELREFRRVTLERGARPVTSDAAAESRVAEQREILRHFVEFSPTPMAMFDRDMNYLCASRRWATEFGVPLERLIGENHYAVFPGVDATWVDRRDRALTGETIRTGDEMVVRPDGSTAYYQSVVRPWYTSEDTVGGLIMTFDWTTRRATAERALRSVEQRFRAITEQSHELIVEFDDRGRIVYASPSHLPLFGFDPEAMKGKRLLDLAHPQDRPRLRNEMRKIEPATSREHPPIRYYRADGDIRWVEAASRSFVATDGSVHTLSIGRDVTERVLAEEAREAHRTELEHLVEERTRQLMDANERLHRSQRLASIGTLAAGIAHQINNPIGSILAASEYALLCTEDQNGAAIGREALEINRREAQRCGRIVRSILKFAREGRSEKWIETIDSVVHRACNHAGPYAARSARKLRWRFDAGESRALMNPIEIEQVLINVLHNAIESQGSRVVEVRTRIEKDRVVIEVQDDGLGIDAATAQHAFDPFYTTRLDAGGTGLGLSVAHGIVCDHEGSIRLEPAPQGGTVATVELPIADEETIRLHAARAEGSEQAGAPAAESAPPPTTGFLG